MQKFFTKLGYNVKTAESAKEALKFLESEDFQLIITDLHMPGMDGTKLCERIKKSGSRAVVYALSGYLSTFKESIESAGFDGYLSKPVSLGVLKPAVEDAMEKTADQSDLPPIQTDS